MKNNLKECKLNPETFSHITHLRLAWINIKNYGIKKTEINIQSQLQNFVEFAGAKEKYNKTLTIASIRIVYHFTLKSKSNNFKEFLNEFPQLNNGFKELIKCHYSFDVFNSNKAKIEFLKPDLLPFTT